MDNLKFSKLKYKFQKQKNIEYILKIVKSF